MTTRTTFAPAFAPRIWTDGRWLYAEFPSIDNKDGFIIREERTAGALQKILALTPTIIGQPGYINPTAGNIADKLIKEKILTTREAKISPSERRKRHLRSIPQSITDAAEALVEKLKKG